MNKNQKRWERRDQMIISELKRSRIIKLTASPRVKSFYASSSQKDIFADFQIIDVLEEQVSFMNNSIEF